MANRFRVENDALVARPVSRDAEATAPHPAAVRGALAPGEFGERFHIPQRKFAAGLAHGLIVAAGLDPQLTPARPPPLLWRDGADRVLVELGAPRLTFGEGFLDLFLPVSCDETGPATIAFTFVTADPSAAGGFVWACESLPRGPKIIVTRWGEPLVALAWRALVEAVVLFTAAAGRDRNDSPWVPATVFATPEGVTVQPMAAHVFPQLGGRR